MAEEESVERRTEFQSSRTVWPARRPVPSARCAHCGAANVSILRTFATGGGSVFRTLVDDVYCLRCGHMGQPDYHIVDGKANGTAQDFNKNTDKSSGTSR